MPQNPSPRRPGVPTRARAGAIARLADAAIGLGALVAALAGAETAGAATSPAALAAATEAAAAKQQSVHYVAGSILGTESITIVADVARSSGLETIRLRDARQTGLVSARYDGKAVYFKGDANGLTGYVGMPSTLATRYAGKWIAFTPTQKSFAAIAKSLTLSAAVGQISIGPPFTSSTGPTVGNVPTVLVRGTTTMFSSSGAKGRASLSIRTNGTPLPVTFAGRGSQSGKTESGQVVFSGWNEPVHVVAPSSSVNASSISSSGSGSSSSSGSNGG